MAGRLIRGHILVCLCTSIGAGLDCYVQGWSVVGVTNLIKISIVTLWWFIISTFCTQFILMFCRNDLDNVLNFMF